MPLRVSGREDRASRELRAYLRWEYNAEIGWLLAQIHRHREPLGRRLLAWIRRRRTSASGPRTTVTHESRESKDGARATGLGPLESPIEVRRESIPVDTCEHADLVALGSGGRASYWACSECGHVLIMQAGRIWIIRPHIPIKQSAGSTVRATIEQGDDPAKEGSLVAASRVSCHRSAEVLGNLAWSNVPQRPQSAGLQSEPA